tara:strand:- start:128 stop:319 length:192 start_codon:yes stop_codon:yes gene_type:complete
MKVILKKIHPSFNAIFKNEFKVGDVLELKNKKVTTKNGNIFLAKDLCKCFSNICSYSDLFRKI